MRIRTSGKLCSFFVSATSLSYAESLYIILVILGGRWGGHSWRQIREFWGQKNRFCKIIDEFKFRIHILHKTTKRKFLSRTLQLNNKYINMNYWNCAKKKQIATEVISYTVERSTGIAEIRDRIPVRLNFCRLSSLKLRLKTGVIFFAI